MEGEATLMRGQGVSLGLGMEPMQVGVYTHRRLADACSYVYIDLENFEGYADVCANVYTHRYIYI